MQYSCLLTLSVAGGFWKAFAENYKGKAKAAGTVMYKKA